MAEGIVDRLEPVEIEPKKRKFCLLTEIFHRLFETLLEVMAIGETGQRIKARKLFDLGFGGAFVGDVFVQINPSAAIERLGVDPNGATVAKFMHLGEGCAGGNSGSKPSNQDFTSSLAA